MSVYRNPVVQNEWKLLEKASGTTTSSDGTTILYTPTSQELLSSYDEILIRTVATINQSTGTTSKSFGVKGSTFDSNGLYSIVNAYTSQPVGTVYTGDIHLIKTGGNSTQNYFAQVAPNHGSSYGADTISTSLPCFGYSDKSNAYNRISNLIFYMSGSTACGFAWTYKIYGKKYNLPD